MSLCVCVGGAQIVHAQIDTENLLNSTSSTPGSSPMKSNDSYQ